MSDYRQEGTGKVVTEEQLRELVEASGYTFEDYVEKAKLTLVTDDVDKSDFQQGSSESANVLPEVKEAPTGTDSGLDDTFSELPKTDPEDSAERDLLVSSINETERQINNYISQGGEANQSDAAVLQGYKDDLFKMDQNALVGDDFSSDKFEKLQDDEKIRLQEAASNEIQRQYDSDGVVDFK